MLIVVLQIKDAVGNEYGKPKDVVGEKRIAFTSHADSAFDVCFENLLTGSCAEINSALWSCGWLPTAGKHISDPTRHVELDIDIGADAKDWSAVQATEKLKPVEAELRRIEELVAEIVTEMEYLRGREQKLRDTNESTNTRVKWFAFGTMGMLIALGSWQIMYLRAYFRYVSLGRNSRPYWPVFFQIEASYLERVRKYMEKLYEDGWILYMSWNGHRW
jgi:hypothetical protein